MQKHTIFVIVYLVVLHLLLAVTIVKFDTVQRLAEKLSFIESRHQWHYRQMMAFHRRIDTCVPERAVLFIGDSFIQGMCVAAISDRAVNFGIGGDTTEGVLKRLPDYTSLKRARAIVLAVGYNDLRERDNDAILKNCRDILRLIPEDVPILVCSVLPTDERCRQERYNKRIDILNLAVAEVCSSMKHCHFIDIATKLKDCEGNLSVHYHEGDGIHLNNEGYRIYNDAIKSSLIHL